MRDVGTRRHASVWVLVAEPDQAQDHRALERPALPELPDVVVYVERLRALFGGRTLDEIRVISPFVLRTVEPPLTAAEGRIMVGTRRIGKRVVLELEGG